MFSILVYFKIECIPVMTKLNFQQPLLQSSVSHDPSEIIIICSFEKTTRKIDLLKKKFLFNVKNNLFKRTAFSRSRNLLKHYTFLHCLF